MAATAVVLAGSRPGVDAFAQSYGTDLKALILVCEKPMVQRPVGALLASDVETIRVLAQQPERIREVLPSDPRISVEPSGETIASTLEKMCIDPDVRWPILVTTADHALLTPEMIADFLGKAQEADIAIGVVSQDALMKRLPQLWRSNEQNRKKAWRMILTVGLFAGLGALLRLRTLQQTLDSVGRKLNLSIRAVELSDPLAAVDVDKPADHELVTDILEGRA
jgi:GTP:adenosylcobinamide-phosphate guanylyltransferase